MLISLLREGCPLGGPSRLTLSSLVLLRALGPVCGLIFFAQLLSLGEIVDHQVDLAEVKAASGLYAFRLSKHNACDHAL
jgi:hypothetical protein